MKPDKKLRSPGGQINLKGMFHAKIYHNDLETTGKIYVLAEDN